MAINERLIDTAVAAADGNAGEEGLILHLDANDVDSYDGDGDEWVDITDHEYTPTTNVSEHFNTVLWTGNNAATRGITGVGFKPDLVWIKNRNDSFFWHNLWDSVRGVDKGIFSNATAAQDSQSNRGYLSAFQTDGFQLTRGSLDAGNNNETGKEVVAWCFKAGGVPSGSDKVSIDGTSYADEAAAGLTAGDAPVTKLSANTELGFSVATIDNEAGAFTFSHGLGVAPELVILKRTDVIGDWYVYSENTRKDKYLKLNNTSQALTSTAIWQNTSPTSSLVNINLSGDSYDYVFYSFTSKRGVSKVGGYTGTAAAGNKVYTGFEPAFVMLKNTNNSAAVWIMVDNKRDPNNPVKKKLAANSSVAENESTTIGSDTQNQIEFNRDGFTLLEANNYVNTNRNGDNYIYYAVAKNTNETGLIPDTDLELHLDAASFDGSTNTPSTWTDSSGNSNNGTISSGVTFDAELGNWLTLTGGSNHRVTVDDNGALTNVSNFTVEMWMNIKDNNSYRWLCTNMDTTNGKRQVYVILDDSDRLEFTTYSSNSTSNYRINRTNSVASKLHNKWSHLAFVLSGGKVSKIYVNGEEESITYQAGSDNQMHTSSTTDFVIGSLSNIGDTDNANGDIGQVRMYHSALTQAQIKQNFNFTKPNYPNGYDGVLGGGTTANKPTWNSGGYFTFDGSNDYVTTPLTQGISTTCSFACHFRVPDVSGRKFLIGDADAAGSSITERFALELNGDEFRLVPANGTAFDALSSTSANVTANVFHHICVTISGTTVKFYFNGTLINTFTMAFSWGNAGERTYTIGAAGDYRASLLFKGDMSVVQLYDTELTQAQVTALQ